MLYCIVIYLTEKPHSCAGDGSGASAAADPEPESEPEPEQEAEPEAEAEPENEPEPGAEPVKKIYKDFIVIIPQSTPLLLFCAVAFC